MDTLERAREHHRRHAWVDACAAFRAAEPLSLDDLERLAECTQVLGRIDEAVVLRQRLYAAYVEAGAVGRAMRTAFYLAHALVVKGEPTLASGWLARAGRLAPPEAAPAERGYLLIPEAEQRFGAGDPDGAFATAAEIDPRGDPDLAAIALHIQGRARIRQARVAEGLAMLDEALVEVSSGVTAAPVTSWIYCSVIDACRELHELRRAREWTVALNVWCDARPQYTGVFSAVCRIHRAELLLLGGEWPDAVREARLACDQLTRGYGAALAGPAHYQLAEAHRLRGDAGAAAEAYRAAGQFGGPAQPGLALLWLAQGRASAAAAAVRRALVETRHPLARARLLPAYVEIMLAVPDLPTAREGAAELDGIASAFDTAGLIARAAYADGTVSLAAGDPDAALPALRRAFELWRELAAPYEAARARIGVGLACRALGDEASGTLELDAAHQALAGLGAADPVTPPDRAGLSRRELEVLRLVAAGRSNRAIAETLAISDRTVERHVSNILTKLGVGSRTAAAAYAFANGIH
ncbi:LuxR C-terminal-related transcriptional regulator [Asanoa sp. NPDC050611]|uniref:LuxR C-terminal-related transcriptional regulator n=1 Tax=Asanoa sp. NPDC050611 TaxID=3157098 RepID=UPI0033EC0D30